MPSILEAIETPYIDAQTLLTLLRDYRQPRERILLTIKNKELIRLKNGFYLISDKVMQKGQQTIPYEQIANLLYGPSYVSLEWALSFYGMIPERVHTITSMSLSRSKEYDTSIGHFSYYRLPEKSYPIGIVQKQSSNSVGGFLIASPKKALIDWVFKTCKGLRKEDLKRDFLESKRIELQTIKQLNKKLLIEMAKSFRSRSVSELINLVGIL